MIDHVSIMVSDLERAAAFYGRVLSALGYSRMKAKPGTVGYGKSYPDFWLNLRADLEPFAPGTGAHVAIRADSASAVDDFYAMAMAAGATCAGPPGLRPQYTKSYYAAFIRDPDGNHIEAVTFVSDKAST